MFISYGLLKEVRGSPRNRCVFAGRLTRLPPQLYDLMVPIIFAMNLFGEKLAWPRRRKVPCARGALLSAHLLIGCLHPLPQIAFGVGVPLLVSAFMLFWHAVRARWGGGGARAPWLTCAGAGSRATRAFACHGCWSGGVLRHDRCVLR
jgi:hypothetical protein